MRVAARSAICSLGIEWDEIWQRLLAADRDTISFNTIEDRLPVTVEVAAVRGLDRRLDLYHGGAGAACWLAAVVLSALPEGPISTLYGASNHGESDVVVALAGAAMPDRRLMAALAEDPMASRAAELANRSVGRTIWVHSACSSSAHSLCLAAAALADGVEEEVCVLGADALSALAIAGFDRIGATTRTGAAPLTMESDGILIGEGAAAVCLTRGGSSAGTWLLGAGMAGDAGHQIHPEETGVELERAVRTALAAAGCAPDTVAAVIAHGTGTPANDRLEAEVLARVFGAAKLPVTSLKGSIGHCMGAAGLFNLLAAERACLEGVLPPVGLGGTPREGIDVVLGTPRAIPRGRPVLLLASGFGGNHVALVIGMAS